MTDNIWNKNNYDDSETFENLWGAYMSLHGTPEEYLSLGKTFNDFGDDLWDMWYQWDTAPEEDRITIHARYSGNFTPGANRFDLVLKLWLMLFSKYRPVTI